MHQALHNWCYTGVAGCSDVLSLRPHRYDRALAAAEAGGGGDGDEPTSPPPSPGGRPSSAAERGKGMPRKAQRGQARKAKAR